jgi:translation initiation factor IF-1
MKEEPIELESVIATVLAGTMFRVELENKHMVLATICGKMRRRWHEFPAGVHRPYPSTTTSWSRTD